MSFKKVQYSIVYFCQASVIDGGRAEDAVSGKLFEKKKKKRETVIFAISLVLFVTNKLPTLPLNLRRSHSSVYLKFKLNLQIQRYQVLHSPTTLSFPFFLFFFKQVFPPLFDLASLPWWYSNDVTDK